MYVQIAVTNAQFELESEAHEHLLGHKWMKFTIYIFSPILAMQKEARPYLRDM